MISTEEALRLTLKLASKPVTEVVAIRHALGRVLAAAAPARLTQPPFDASSMDGYAVSGRDLPGPLKLIGTSAAGRPYHGPTPSGSTVRIFTGAEVPEGYDRVIMQEEAKAEGDLVHFDTASTASNIRKKGADFSEGWSLETGRVLRHGDLALLAAMNIPEVTVAKRPKVAILAGGDELLPPGSELGEGQIICSNDVAVAAIAQEAGAEVTILPIAKDTAESITASLKQVMDHDLIVTIGGASVGDHDLIGEVTATLGMTRAFYKIAMRPGKPLIAGKLDRAALLGLPGNPVSSIVCANIFMYPLIKAMQGAEADRQPEWAQLGEDIPAEGNRRHYLRAKLVQGKGLAEVTPFSDQDSSKLSILSQADCLMIRDAHDPARKKGELMQIIRLE